jgi:hypothetical protein
LFSWWDYYDLYKMFFPLQTAKDDTAYTQVSDKPEVEPSENNYTNQPMRNGSYIAMSPVEAQKC